MTSALKYKGIPVDHMSPEQINAADGERFAHYDGDPFVFFIDLVEQDGGRVGLWTGSDYEEAVREAELCRREWKIDEPVHDRIVGGGQNEPNPSAPANDNPKPYLRVAVWFMLDQGYAVVGARRGPTLERIGNFYTTKDEAMHAARLVSRKHVDIHFEDMRPS